MPAADSSCESPTKKILTTGDTEVTGETVAFLRDLCGLRG